MTLPTCAQPTWIGERGTMDIKDINPLVCMVCVYVVGGWVYRCGMWERKGCAMTLRAMFCVHHQWE